MASRVIVVLVWQVAARVAGSGGDEVALWRNCHGPVGAYAAAWLLRRDTCVARVAEAPDAKRTSGMWSYFFCRFMETRFGNSLGMEYHDYFVYHQGGNGR